MEKLILLLLSSLVILATLINCDHALEEVVIEDQFTGFPSFSISWDNPVKTFSIEQIDDSTRRFLYRNLVDVTTSWQKAWVEDSTLFLELDSQPDGMFGPDWQNSYVYMDLHVREVDAINNVKVHGSSLVLPKQDISEVGQFPILNVIWYGAPNAFTGDERQFAIESLSAMHKHIRVYEWGDSAQYEGNLQKVSGDTLFIDIENDGTNYWEATSWKAYSDTIDLNPEEELLIDYIDFNQAELLLRKY